MHFQTHVDEERFVTGEMIDVEVVDSAIRFTYTGDINQLLSHLGQFNLQDVSIDDPRLDDIFKHYYGNDQVQGSV